MRILWGARSVRSTAHGGTARADTFRGGPSVRETGRLRAREWGSESDGRNGAHDVVSRVAEPEELMDGWLRRACRPLTAGGGNVDEDQGIHLDGCSDPGMTNPRRGQGLAGGTGGRTDPVLPHRRQSVLRT